VPNKISCVPNKISCVPKLMTKKAWLLLLDFLNFCFIFLTIGSQFRCAHLMYFLDTLYDVQIVNEQNIHPRFAMTNFQSTPSTLKKQ